MKNALKNQQAIPQSARPAKPVEGEGEKKSEYDDKTDEPDEQADAQQAVVKQAFSMSSYKNRMQDFFKKN